MFLLLPHDDENSPQNNS